MYIIINIFEIIVDAETLETSCSEDWPPNNTTIVFLFKTTPSFFCREFLPLIFLLYSLFAVMTT